MSEHRMRFELRGGELVSWEVEGMDLERGRLFVDQCMELYRDYLDSEGIKFPPRLKINIKLPFPPEDCP